MVDAVTTSTDPVETLVDLLSGAADPYWTTPPARVEMYWESDYKKKVNRSGMCMYLYSPEDGTREQLSIDGGLKDIREVIAVEVWSPDAQTTVTAAGEAATILEDYWNDKTPRTKWLRIRPRRESDRRQEALPSPGSKRQYVIELRVDMHRLATIGPS